MNISNIFSGLAINLERPFKIGDMVKIYGHLGKVENMTWQWATQPAPPLRE